MEGHVTRPGMSIDRHSSSIRTSPQRALYVERVNAVIDFIELHLGEELTLEQLSEVAHFSPYHFHRIFSVMTGETLSRFVNRVRYERAASMLVQHPTRSVTELASQCGLPNPSSFSRSFREHFGMTPSEWRAGGYRKHKPTPELRSLKAVAEGFGVTGTEFDPDTGRMRWTIGCGDLDPTSVQIVDIPDLEVAYIRHTGRYQGLADVFAEIFTRLMNWAGSRQLISEDSWVLSLYHDDPSITDDNRLRLSACIDVPAETEVDGEIGRTRLDGGLCAIARFELGAEDYATAWFALSSGWLPDSGYEPDDRLPFERYPIGVSTTSPGKEVVDIAIPVRPLRRY